MINKIFDKFDGAFAPNTIRAYRSDFIQYEKWCIEQGIKPIPATADSIASYVDYLSHNAKNATIRRRINSLGTILKLSKNYDPTKEPEVTLALKRMHRRIGRAQVQAAPLTKSLLNQLLDSCDNSNIRLRNKVLLRLGYETMRRRSELCSFRFEDISQSANGKSVITLTFSKTDQCGIGKVMPVSKELMSLLKDWGRVAGNEGYILRAINRHGQISDSLNPSGFTPVLRITQKRLIMGQEVSDGETQKVLRRV